MAATDMATAGIIYGVNETVGSGSVTGTITTDGTIGTLVSANILDFSLLLNDGSDSFTVSKADGILFRNQGGTNGGEPLLTSTPENLFFDFTENVSLIRFGSGDASFSMAADKTFPIGAGLRIEHYFGLSSHSVSVGRTWKPGGSIRNILSPRAQLLRHFWHRHARHGSPSSLEGLVFGRVLKAN